MIKNNLRKIRMSEYLLEPQAFANMLGLNYKTYYGLESGFSRPKLEHALIIAQKLNRTIEDIWYLEED